MKHLWIVLLLAGLMILIGCGKEPSVEPPPVDPPVEENEAPIAWTPFIATSSQEAGAHIILDLRYRMQGCDASGNPTSVTGAMDPDGDSLEYKIECEWSVFERDTERKLNGEWVTFHLVTNPNGNTEQDAVVELWIGWTEGTPLMPVSPMACDPSPGPRSFTYTVHDGKGASASHTVFVGR